MEISRWCKPPIPPNKMRASPRGAVEWCRAILATAPLGLGVNVVGRTGGLHHRLTSDVPSGQLAARTTAEFDEENFLAVTLMRDKSKE